MKQNKQLIDYYNQLFKKTYSILNPNNIYKTSIYNINLINDVFRFDDYTKEHTNEYKIFLYDFIHLSVLEILYNQDKFNTNKEFSKLCNNFNKIYNFQLLEDYYLSSNIYDEVLKCINFKANNPKPFKKVEYVSVYIIDNEIYASITLYNGVDVSINNIRQKLSYIDVIDDICNIVDFDYKSVHNSIYERIKSNITFILTWYLKLKFEHD